MEIDDYKLERKQLKEQIKLLKRRLDTMDEIVDKMTLDNSQLAEDNNRLQKKLRDADDLLVKMDERTL